VVGHHQIQTTFERSFLPSNPTPLFIPNVHINVLQNCLYNYKIVEKAYLDARVFVYFIDKEFTRIHKPYSS